MAVAGGRELALLVQLVQTVLPERLQQPVPLLTLAPWVYLYQRLVDERGEHVEQPGGRIAVIHRWLPDAQALDGVEGEAAGEDRQAPQQGLLSLREQVVAPVDGAA